MKEEYRNWTGEGGTHDMFHDSRFMDLGFVYDIEHSDGVLGCILFLLCKIEKIAYLDRHKRATLS